MVVVKILGGLGNQISQYLFGLFCAEKFGVELRVDVTGFESYKLWSYSLNKLFKNINVATSEEILVAKGSKNIRERELLYDKSIINELQASMYLDGYWADYRYSCKYDDVLSDLLVLPYSNEPFFLEVLGKIKFYGDRSVSIHFRRGDYVTNKSSLVLPVSYYYNAVCSVNKVVNNPVFFIFSDDIKWVKESFNIDGDFYYVENLLSNYDDMFLMSSCHNNVIANSTFSGWAARLNRANNKLVIYPEKYFRADDDYLKSLYGKVVQPVYPPSWKRVAFDEDSKIVIGVWNFYEDLNTNNFFLINRNASIGDELLKPFNELREFGLKEGVLFNTLPMVDDWDKVDLFLFFDFPCLKNQYVKMALSSNKPKFLVIFETDVVKPDNWDYENHRFFDKIFTWNDSYIDFNKYYKLNFVQDLILAETNNTFSTKKLCVMINSAKSIIHPNSLYQNRIDCIKWFEMNHPDNFDLYGVGWNKSDFPSYVGVVERKLNVLQNYRFSICFENAVGYPGYITEKIFDCFNAKCVPIYYGASNIELHIPSACFIDFRDFSGFAELFSYISNISEEEYCGYLCAVEEYYNCYGPGQGSNQYCYLYTIDSFVWTLVHQIKKTVLSVRGLSPRVSVCIPTYNQKLFLEHSIQSVLDQNIGDIQIVVVDNASTDKTELVFDKYRNIYSVKFYRNPVNYGSYINHLRAYEACYGDYFAVLHSDDFYGDNHLLEFVNSLDLNPKSVVAYCPCYWVNESDEIVKAAYHNGHKKANYIGFRNEVADLLIYDCYITPSAALIRRECYDLISFEIEGIKYKIAPLYGATDWAQWIWLAYNYHDFIFFNRPSVYYRVHPHQHSQEFYKTLQPLLDHLSILEWVVGLNNINVYLFDFKDLIISHLNRRLSLYPKDMQAKVLGRVNDVVHAIKNVNEFSSKENQTSVSVIVPTFNRKDSLNRCLFSLCDQVYKNFDVIVINDGGEDVKDIVGNYKNMLNIIYVTYFFNKKQSAARNLGLKIASGDVICFLDDDDIFLPNHINAVVKGIRNSRFVYTLADYVIEDSNGNEVGRQKRYQDRQFSKNNLYVDNYIPINTWGVNRSLFDLVGLFDESMECLEDWDMLIRLSNKCEFLNIKEITVEVHLRQNIVDGVSSRNFNSYYKVYNEIYIKYGYLGLEDIKLAQKQMLANLSAKPMVSNLKTSPAVSSYSLWKNKHDPKIGYYQIFIQSFQTWRVLPRYLIIVVFETNKTNLLADTIDSLTWQFYSQWSLAIISTSPSPDPLFDEMEMVHWLQVDDDPYQALNQVLANVDAFDWVAVIPPGAVFSENALSVVSNYINQRPEWCFIYADEDLIDSKGTFIDPLFKPDFNLELLRSTPYMGDACFVRKSVIDELGGYCGLAGVLNWDLSFKIFERLGASSIGHVPEVLFHRPKPSISDAEQQYLVAAEKLTVLRHLERLETKAAVTEGLVLNTYFVDYPLISQPLVSIVLTIVNAEQLGRVNEAIEVLAKNTEYANYEIFLTSSLPDSDVLKVVGELEIADRHIHYSPFQGDLISPLSNQALKTLNGDYVLLFSPDLTVLHQHWLETLMAQGLRDEVGIVGARIVDTDKNIHHAGIVLGMGDFGVADYPNRNLPINQPGYMNRAAVVQNFSAVSTQCFLVKKQLLLDLPVNAKANVFDHIEFCLNVRQKGYAIVWTPFVTLMLSHQVLQECSMDQLRSDADQVIKNWLPQLANDPAYNRNLSLKHRHFQIETETDVTWNVDFHDRPRVYAFPANDSGVGEYRVRSPLRALTHAAKIQSSLLPNHSETLIPDIVEIERAKPDVLLLQNGTASYLLHAWEQYRKFNDVFMIYSQDDLIYMLPGKHPLQGKWPKDLRKRLRKLLEHSDRLIVATEPLKEEYSRWISDVKIVPNYLEKAKWLELSFNSKSRDGKKLRVGWAGGAQHQGDLEFILPVVEATRNEVDWIFMGMCPEQIRPFIKEYHAGVVFDLYPQKLADLDLDLAIAPLEYNNFNMAKTNLRLLEYGVLGWPVVCSDITPYRNAPVTRVSNNVNHWIKVIREKVNEPDELVKEGQVLKQWVLDHFLLEDHLDEWMAAITPS